MLELGAVPHRSPGAPGRDDPGFLTGEPIHYYRPRGSADIRRLIDDGFQAFNAGVSSEACRVFSDRMLDPSHETTIGLTMAGALTPAGLGGWRHRVDGSRADRLRHQHRRQPVSRPALRAELHVASAARRSSTTWNSTMRASSVSMTCCFPRPCCSRPTPTFGKFLVRGKLDGPMSSAEFHYRLGCDLLDHKPGL